MPKLTDKENRDRLDNDVQTILVSKFYPYTRAYQIIRELGYNTYGFDDNGDEYYRFRQFNPGSFRTRPRYKTIDSSSKPGVKFIIEFDSSWD